MIGLVREAAGRALEDANWADSDIDAVVIGKAPDAFEGVMQPELFLGDALGAAGKPMLRVHTAGSVGGSTAIVAAHLVEAGIHQRVLGVAWEKQSEGNAQWGLAGGKSGGIGAGGAFAPFIQRYIAPDRAPEYIGWMVAVKDRLNTLEEPVRPPAAQGHHDREGQGVADAVGAAALPRVVPLQRRGVRGRDRRRGGGKAARQPPAWIAATSVKSELGQFPGRDATRPQAGVDCAHDVYQRRASPTRARRSTSPRSTCRSAGTSRCGSKATTSPVPARAGRWWTAAQRR